MRLFLALLLAPAMLAQSPVLSVESLGRDAAAHVLRVYAVDAAALDVLGQAAAAAAVPLRVDPAILETLAARTITIRRDRIVLDELGLLVALKLGVSAAISGGGLKISPGGTSPQHRTSQALEHVEHSLLGHADPQLMAPLRYHRASLLFAAGASDEAAAAFGDLVRDFPGHSLSADARLLAVAAALRAGRHAECLSMIAAIEESRGGLPEVPGAILLPARVHAAAGNLKEALLRARKAAASGRFERDRVLAGLIAAEIHYRLGDGTSMMEALDALPPRFERTCRDLVPKTAFARGLALRLLHDERAALLHLRVALRSVDESSRPAVAQAICECLAALGDLVPAWIAARQAESLEKDPAEVRRIQARRAELEESLGASGRAAATCLSILQSATGPFPEAERVLATLARCFLSAEKVEDARTALEALTDREAWRTWALFRIALLDRKGKNPERALRALARIDSSACAPLGPTAEEIRTLRGQLLLEIGDPLQAAEVFRGSHEEVPK